MHGFVTDTWINTFALSCSHVSSNTCTDTYMHTHPYRVAYYKPTSHIEGFIHQILCHLCLSMFHSFRTASFGLTGSQNRFIGAVGESYYNVSGQRGNRGKWRDTALVVNGNLGSTASFTHNAVSTAVSCHSHCTDDE